MRSSFAVIVITLLGLGATPDRAFGQDISASGSSKSVGNGLLISGHAFFYSDNSSLGSEVLNDGASTFLRGDLQYNWQDFFLGLGVFYEQDSFGAGEKDSAFGPIVEIVLGSFYAKVMPGVIQQAFVDRSFAKRSGSFFATQFGVRGAFYESLIFYEVALQRRSQTITQEDEREMADALTKTEILPILGMGISL